MFNEGILGIQKITSSLHSLKEPVFKSSMFGTLKLSVLGMLEYNVKSF